jgi:phosphoglycerate dehydrogenase-like enzyme
MTVVAVDGLHKIIQRIESREARIGIVGMGYVGLPLALLFSEERFAITGFDIAESGRVLHCSHSRHGYPVGPEEWVSSDRGL